MPEEQLCGHPYAFKGHDSLTAAAAVAAAVLQGLLQRSPAVCHILMWGQL